MSPGAKISVVVLFVLNFALAAITFVASVGYYHREQASQQRQGQVLEHRLCTSLNRLAAQKPPAGSPAGNPSRAFDQEQHAVLAQLGPDVGCPAVKP